MTFWNWWWLNVTILWPIIIIMMMKRSRRTLYTLQGTRMGQLQKNLNPIYWLGREEIPLDALDKFWSTYLLFSDWNGEVGVWRWMDDEGVGNKNAWTWLCFVFWGLKLRYVESFPCDNFEETAMMAKFCSLLFSHLVKKFGRIYFRLIGNKWTI